MQGLLIERIKIYFRQIREKMSTFDAYFTRGGELYNEKKYNLAIEFFKIALKQSNAENYAYYNLALAYQQLDLDDKALENYKTFLEKYPNDQNSLYNVALIHYKKKQYEEAAKYFAESFKYKQDEANIKALAETYMQIGDTEKASELAEYIFNSDCNKKYALLIAKVFEEQDPITNNFTLTQKAIDIYIKLLEFQPGNFDAALAASVAYSKMGDWENAITYCNLALELKPKSYEANSQMGLILYCSDNMPECIAYYEKTMKIKRDYKIHLNLAYAYEKAGKLDDAIQLFKETLTKFSNFPQKEEVRKHVRQLLENEKEKAN